MHNSRVSWVLHTINAIETGKMVQTIEVDAALKGLNGWIFVRFLSHFLFLRSSAIEQRLTENYTLLNRKQITESAKKKNISPLRTLLALVYMPSSFCEWVLSITSHHSHERSSPRTNQILHRNTIQAVLVSLAGVLVLLYSMSSLQKHQILLHKSKSLLRLLSIIKYEEVKRRV